jgi:catechol 2,3-dioxygenase-like lactoylglutathione lyase family enzyme
MTPRIHRVLETALYCQDLQACARFYERLLAASPMLASSRLVAFDAGHGTVLLLFQRGTTDRPFETPGGLIPGHGTNGPGHVAFAVDRSSIGGWVETLTGLGVAVESRVEWSEGGESVYFRDPEGNSVELATPGTWTSY